MAKLQMSLKARALKYLSTREHSRSELARKLARYAQEEEDVDGLLDTLASAGLLSEARFSESLIRRRAPRYGNARILSELQSHGLHGESIDVLRQSLEEGESDRATMVLRRKYATPPADASEKARRIRFLQQRGFSAHAIRLALRAVTEQDGGDDDGALGDA